MKPVTLRLQIGCLVLFLASTLVAQEFKNLSGAIVKYPKVSFDGSRMIFMANYYGVYKPFVSYYDTDSSLWAKPQPILENLPDGYTIKDLQFSFDNSKIYFSASTAEKSDYDIYFSVQEDGAWSIPAPLEIGVNSDLDELGVAMSSDEKKMLFTRPLPPEEKADDYCGVLYFTELTEAGFWSEPEPLPPAYNTGCICSPYYSRDNKTFYYASYEDVIDSEGKRISKNQFSIMWAKIDGLFRYNPRAIAQIITGEDLVSPSFNIDSTLYYAAGKYTKGESKIESMLYSVDLTRDFTPDQMSLIQGRVTDKSGEPLDAIVQVIDPYTTKVYLETKSDANGNYQFLAPMDLQYSLLASKQGFSSQSKLIETLDLEIVNDFELFPQVNTTFNVFDEEFYFPISDVKLDLRDSAFNVIRTIDVTEGEAVILGLGKELNIVFNSENYFSDTLNLPFDEEVIFDFFDFDIELRRKLKDVSLFFTDEDGNNLGLEVTVYNVTRNEKTKRRVKDGKISLQLRDGEVYEISTSAQGYSYYSEQLDLSEEDVQSEVKAELKSIENVSLVLNNITFATNSYELNAESYTELDKLINYLVENENYNVEISAHTDDAGAEKYNLKLSNLRANSVLEYLQDNSINQDRLIAKGYGESLPLYPNDTEENQARNRRVEFKILSE